ncbi:RagB/SusD family nutrient uptake outer membrane protein [Spirosoma harenae]
MKKPMFKGVILTAMCSLITFACSESFLETPATGALTSTQLTSRAGLDGLLISAYSQLNGRGYNQAAASLDWVRGSVSGGDGNKGSNSGDFNSLTPFMTYQLQTTAGDVEQKWLALYEGVSRSNMVLRMLAQASADVTAADKTRIQAEARFLRGHYYFWLKRQFNNTPYVDESVDYGTGVEKVTNDADLWPKIEADFKFAADNLAGAPGAVGRANKWAATAYLAKTYLYQKKYADAKALFDQVIANGTTSTGTKYALVDSYTDIFNAAKENNSESVFADQAAANAGSSDNANPNLNLNFPYNTGSNGPAGCCGFFPPSFELANSFRVTATGLPLLDGSYNSAANQLKTDQGVATAAAFTPDAGPVDPRLDWSVGRRGIPYLDWQVHPGQDWIRDQGFAGPYSPKKFIFYKSQDKVLTDGSSWTDGYMALNVNFIRFADVLLMAAECEVEVGSLETARTYVNMVRNRAAKSDYWVKTSAGANAANYVIAPYPASQFATKDGARAAVQFERKLELSGEGHRFFDLVRWGTAATVLNAFVAYEGSKLPVGYAGAKFTAGRDEYLPIPQNQIDLQGKTVLKQNPGY